VNGGVAEAMVAGLGEIDGTGVIEIGPGHGILTRMLLDRGARVVAVEIDPVLADALVESMGEVPGFALLQADALEVRWSDLSEAALAGAAAPVRLCASLPYESGTRILLDWLEASAADPRMPEAVVMLQAEVGERLVARPRTKAFGSLGAIAQSTHAIRSHLDVSPGSFRPQPKIWSKVLRLTRLESPLFAPEDRKRHATFIQAAFAHRRKQLASDLAGQDGLTREQWQELIVALGHPATARAEELTPPELVALSQAARADRRDG
jgi:16S rRNA (adenine1518-N6/adenine1519-N6)-dimethyltransferase